MSRALPDVSNGVTDCDR